ncbi:hypothetical protein DOTSEDRAFT_67990 [Dothistroma septosporum NZE10]|uniref:Myosin class II heavy chain n=1 Tax=Dothistroma septosporum (strain NZE10 / CBS 128990) TaxID=675120 RepID=N1Q0D0_DOTSN|nr:hypothetical protein DOTSEDRAFT_67990 [Dothistroma septosporum NZE10]
MATLFDSRWAATPPSDQDSLLQRAHEEKQGMMSSRWADADASEPSLAQAIQDSSHAQKPADGVFASRWADTPEPPELEQEKELGLGAGSGSADKNVSAESKEETGPRPRLAVEETVPVLNAGPTSVDAMEKPLTGSSTEGAVVQQGQSSSSSAQVPAPTRLEPPRLKKRVSWRGKNIVISIPRLNHGATGLTEPMGEVEIRDRLQRFQDAGYDINGYDLMHDMSGSDGAAQVRAIFPDESEARFLPPKSQVRVLLPDLERWKAYTDWLTEQKLAALGVTLGFDEPAAPTPVQEMSRQSSTQYPPLPFSPPIPSTSAGSLGRPPMARGHSHTMSVAAPISPLHGPYGHMHRHSTYTGPIGLPQLQPPQQPSPGFPGLQPFSPQHQFALSSMPRVGSPAQIPAFRHDLSIRGPGSPLNQQILPQSPQDYSRGMIEDQRRRQHTYSQSMQQPMVPNTFVSQGSSLRPTPALPELPEDDEEEDLTEPDASTYVPPHKRFQANTDIAVPTPRGHRHNISEGLERELVEAEQRQKAASRDWIEVTEEDDSTDGPSKPSSDGARKIEHPNSVERDPLGSEHPVQETRHSHKKSASRFNVTAPAFTFNPGANFKPSASLQGGTGFQSPQSTFGFAAPDASTSQPSTANHRRHQSSGSFNASAPPFKPASSEFSFSSVVPTMEAKDPTGAPIPTPDGRGNIIDELPSIFGKVQIPDIVKPVRRSKAIAIVRPDENKSSESASDFEDDEGRVAQGEAKRKQMRKVDDDGDDVPRFAEPTPLPELSVAAEKVLGSNDTRAMSTVVEVEGEEEPADDITEKGTDIIEPSSTQPSLSGPTVTTTAVSSFHGHRHAASLSALAKPFEPPMADDSIGRGQYDNTDSTSDLEEGEIREAKLPHASSIKPAADINVDSSLHHLVRGPVGRHGPYEYSSNEGVDQAEPAEPSFDEIDAVMRRLNEAGPELEPQVEANMNMEPQVEANMNMEPQKDVSPERLPSPGSHPMKGVTYLAEWSRSEAPSPSPRRRQLQHEPYTGAQTDNAEQGLNGWSEVRQLNRAEEVATSDWSGVLSPPDEDKLQERSAFFDSHIDSVIGRVVDRRLQPLEESLRSIHNTVVRRNRSSDLKLQRSPSNIESDADDEDELSDERKQRPISRGRDKRVDQIKAAVLEALREQSPTHSQTALDLSELHSVLADMKVSFARAASSSLELDDVRAVVEDSLSRQSQAIVPITIDEGKESHRRQLSELEGRLNETLAGALEEANHRRAVEERETEARRQLRLAEEELHILRNTAHDDESRVRAMEQEREDILSRLDGAEDMRRTAEDKLEDVEAEKEALQATLEEYRASSNKWRHDIDDGKRMREELETTIASMERQSEEYQDSTLGMKRRLEKLHADTATAAGQLASEKAIWKAREEDYRVKIDNLESQNMTLSRERAHLQDEVRIVRASALEAAETRHTVEHIRATNTSLDEMVRKLQGELTEKQALAARFERQFHDAQESGRAEVHRMRMSLQTEVEAANHHVNLVRAELESELAKQRSELDNVTMEAETAKERHEHSIEQEEVARREALRKVNHANSVALDEARHKYESAIQELTVQQTRALTHAIEDKNRAEALLGEKLSLSDAKVDHLLDRVSYLEERLEVAKSAAQAAAKSAKVSKNSVPQTHGTRTPEKVSPQALRESILVLQEQLQERESEIERLQAHFQTEGVAKIKERDAEITWLRELLDVRCEELKDLVSTLSKPNFDRAAARDTAIRISTNLQMEQQERDRSSRSAKDQTLSAQALSSLSSFATPKLASAFNKWRSSMEPKALRDNSAPTLRPRPDQRRPDSRSHTPSKAPPRASPADYSLGLMTPPASNLRNSPVPVPQDAVPEARLEIRGGSEDSATIVEPHKRRSRHSSSTSDRLSTPLFHEQSYDHDAADHDMQQFDDDLEDVADSEPPAFRSLEAALEPETVVGAD